MTFRWLFGTVWMMSTCRFIDVDNNCYLQWSLSSQLPACLIVCMPRWSSNTASSRSEYQSNPAYAPDLGWVAFSVYKACELQMTFSGIGLAITTLVADHATSAVTISMIVMKNMAALDFGNHSWNLVIVSLVEKCKVRKRYDLNWTTEPTGCSKM